MRCILVFYCSKSPVGLHSLLSKSINKRRECVVIAKEIFLHLLFYRHLHTLVRSADCVYLEECWRIDRNEVVIAQELNWIKASIEQVIGTLQDNFLCFFPSRSRSPLLLMLHREWNCIIFHRLNFSSLVFIMLHDRWPIFRSCASLPLVWLTDSNSDIFFPSHYDQRRLTWLELSFFVQIIRLGRETRISNRFARHVAKHWS